MKDKKKSTANYIKYKPGTFFCDDLPTKPRKNAGTILVTGASGYIGGRLVPELLNRGYKVRIVVRSHATEFEKLWPAAEVILADALNYNSLRVALRDVDTAYYLIHSLLLGPRHFHETDVKAAHNFKNAALENKIKRIIYLGGLGHAGSKLSKHLQSRLMVSEELKKGKIPVTILRAAIIIGSGSASYEILHHIAMRLNTTVAPKWTNNKSQPIGIRDVIKYLVGCLEKQETSGKAFDIGGQDILTYREMTKSIALILNKKISLLPIPFNFIALSSYAINLLTPVPGPIIRSLIESGKNEVICLDNTIREMIPFEPLTFTNAIMNALAVEELDHVSTRWSDAYPKDHKFATKLHELRGDPEFQTTYTISSGKSPEALFKQVCKIGGKEGWFNTNWLWHLRGKMDEMILGVGTSRGRKSTTRLKINDVVDFWRVEDIRKNKRLLLRAEMKMPGYGWLEFKIYPEEGPAQKRPGEQKMILSITGHYHTKTLFGRMYWYIFLPFHHFIYQDLIKEIEKRS